MAHPLRNVTLASAAFALLLVSLLWFWRGWLLPLTMAPVKTDNSAIVAATGNTSTETNTTPLTPAEISAANVPPKKTADFSPGDFVVPGTGSASMRSSATAAATDHSVAADLPTIVTTRVRTTAYTHTESDHIKYGTLTALGTHLRYSPEYHSVAADWSRFPLGTKFRMRGHDRLFVVDDYGKALVGSRTVDVYFPTKERMNHWGVRWIDIEVVEFGNFHESRKILAARANYDHCREMLASMTSDDWWKEFR